MDASYIIAPLLGGVIGYITNDIAIRMLFRPHTAKYLFGIHIPFTPGIIPKEKGRIAEAIGGLGGKAASLFGGNIVAKFLGMLREPAEHFLAKNINTMLKNNGEEIVSNMIGGEVDSFLNKPVCKLLEGREEQLAQGVNTVEGIYRTVITDHLPKILDSIDIGKIVRERINEMDVNETERLIFKIMNKELKAIVWLGALLGLIMGSINCLIN